jgi:hypothetical protein
VTELARYDDRAFSKSGAPDECLKKTRQGAGDHFGLGLAEPACLHSEPSRVADLGNDKIGRQQGLAIVQKGSRGGSVRFVVQKPF